MPNSHNSIAAINEQADYKRVYYVFNMVILAIVTVSQLVLYLEMESLSDSTSIINLSGKQRMLSQKIVKQVYYFRENESSENEIILRQSLVDFANNHDVLLTRDGRFGISGNNSQKIDEKLKLLSSYIDRFQNSARCVLGDSDQCELDMETYLLELKRNEVLYLSLIDNIVFSFEEGIKNEIRTVKIIMLVCFLIFSFIILISGKFIFNPIFDRIRERNKKIAKKKEAALNKFHDAKISTLTSTVSSEVRDKVQSLQNSLDQLKSDQPHVVERAYNNIDSLAISIKNIMYSMEKVTNSSLISNVEIFNVKEALEDISDIARDIIIEKDIEFEIEDVEAHLFARGLKAQVSQVIINFITNSIARIGDLSTRWIKISVSKDSSNCIITIKDSSYGLDISNEDIYEPLTHSSELKSGEGFTLWISAKILEKQNGSIVYDFSETHTSFKIRLPLPGSEYNIQI